MIEHDYNSLTELVERWRHYDPTLSENRLLRYGKEGKLRFSIVLKPFDVIEEIHILTVCNTNKGDVVNKVQIIYEGGECPVEVTARFVGNFFESLKNGASLTINFLDLQLILHNPSNDYALVPIPIPDITRDDAPLIYFSARDFVVKIEEVRRFESEFNQSNLPAYLDKNNPYYSEELAAAVRAWESIFINKTIINRNQTLKDNVELWLKKNYPSLTGEKDKNDTAIGRICRMINIWGRNTEQWKKHIESQPTISD